MTIRVLVAVGVVVAVGCMSTPKQSKPTMAARFGAADRFEICDEVEPIDFTPIVISDPNHVQVLIDGYCNLEWDSYFGTIPGNQKDYVLRGFDRDKEVVHVSVSPSGGFMEGYGERVANFEGKAKVLFRRLIEDAKGRSKPLR